MRRDAVIITSGLCAVAAISLLDEELAERWQRHEGAPVPRSLFDAPPPTIRLVACDLEADCGPASRIALPGCIDDAAACGLDVHQQTMRPETPTVQRRIEDTRAAYLYAITSGDYAIWGL